MVYHFDFGNQTRYRGGYKHIILSLWIVIIKSSMKSQWDGGESNKHGVFTGTKQVLQTFIAKDFEYLGRSKV